LNVNVNISQTCY